jgi:glycosyltransferase involved in cell wall biosynthesis
VSSKRKPILGIDASRSLREYPTGVERYSTEIIKAILTELKGFDFKLYTPKYSPHFPKKIQRRIRLPRLWTLVRLSLEMLLHKPDALFIPAHTLPFFAPKKSYVTIHDVAFERYPMAYGALQSFYLEWSTRRAVKRSKMVITPTESVKKDLMKYYNADPKKIAVVNHGRLPLLEINEKEIQDSLAHYQLNADEPLFFFIGRLETKKNLLVLLDAWAIVQKKHPVGRLFLGGMFGHGFADLFKRMEEDDLRGTVIAPGFISEQDVASIFNAASAMILPSREEGFGLPVLQSFEADCAVICSDIPALREVAGDAALYADPGSAKDFAAAMCRLIEEKDLRKELSNLGKSRLKQFSWSRAAKECAEIIRTDL